MAIEIRRVVTFGEVLAESSDILVNDYQHTLKKKKKKS